MLRITSPERASGSPHYRKSALNHGANACRGRSGMAPPGLRPVSRRKTASVRQPSGSLITAVQHATDHGEELEPVSRAANGFTQVMDPLGLEVIASAGCVEKLPEPRPHGRITRFQMELQMQMQKQQPFRFLDLPAEIRCMVFDQLISRKIHLWRRYTGKGGNSTVAFILGLLHINHQLRQEALDYICYRKPTFSISIHDAHSFPLQLVVRRLELHTVELDEKTMHRYDCPTFDSLPTDKTRDAIEMFGQCWAGHRVEEVRLHLWMAPNTQYKGGAYGTNLTVASTFAPLGHFNKVWIRCSLRNVPSLRLRNCRRAFKGVAKILVSSLRLPVEDRW